MVSAHALVALGLACVVLIVVPGPSVLFVVGRALTYGRRIAFSSVAGNAAGCALGAVLVAIGLGEIVQRSDAVYEAIKYAGAAYLVWLGIQAIRHRHNSVEPTAISAPTTFRSLRAGLIVGVTNPKNYIVMAAILPQFVDRGAGHVPAQMLLLALVPLSIGLVSDSTWALVAGTARDWFVSRPRRLTLIGRAGGLCMIGLGVSVAVTGSRTQ
jgi:threonine/homoserine/homoserine lactone efflux protein